MKCEEIEAKLYRYADGEAESLDRSAVETHLAGCPACRALLAEVKMENEALRNALAEPEWDVVRLGQLIGQLEKNPLPAQNSPALFWISYWSDTRWLAISLLLASVIFAVAGFDGMAVYRMTGLDPSQLPVERNLVIGQMVVAGLILLFFVVRNWLAVHLHHELVEI